MNKYQEMINAIRMMDEATKAMRVAKRNLIKELIEAGDVDKLVINPRFMEHLRKESRTK